MQNPNTPDQPRIAVLLLGYNNRPHLGEAFDSILKQTYQNYETFYIDNASSDHSLDYVRSTYPNVTTIANDTNVGFASAYDRSVRKIFHENFQAVTLINPDVVVEPTWLEELVKSAYAHSQIAAAQSKILLHSTEGKRLLNSSGNRINYLGFGFCGNYKTPDDPIFENDQEIPYASGCSVLIKKEAYETVGGLDSVFFAYLEDQDFGWRARMQGWSIVLSARSIVWHKYCFHKSSRKFFLLERNRFLFIGKNYALRTIILIFPMLLFFEFGILFDSIMNHYFIEKLKSYVVFFRMSPHLLSQRKKIQANRKVPDRVLCKYFDPVIEFEAVSSPGLLLANQLLRVYYSLIKPFI